MILKYWKKNSYLGEDFGFFTQQYPGAMFGLGSGITT
jgi:metal-dependent amidase/aminoacylase/carboxypeptidase family protein